MAAGFLVHFQCDLLFLSSGLCLAARAPVKHTRMRHLLSQAAVVCDCETGGVASAVPATSAAAGVAAPVQAKQ